MLTGILQRIHVIVILVVALLVVGPKRLPSAGRALGQGLSEFKRSISTAGAVDRPPSAERTGSSEETLPPR